MSAKSVTILCMNVPLDPIGDETLGIRSRDVAFGPILFVAQDVFQPGDDRRGELE